MTLEIRLYEEQFRETSARKNALTISDTKYVRKGAQGTTEGGHLNCAVLEFGQKC